MGINIIRIPYDAKKCWHLFELKLGLSYRLAFIFYKYFWNLLKLYLKVKFMASNVTLFQCGACWKSALRELQEKTWR